MALQRPWNYHHTPAYSTIEYHHPASEPRRISMAPANVEYYDEDQLHALDDVIASDVIYRSDQDATLFRDIRPSLIGRPFKSLDLQAENTTEVQSV